MLSAASVPAARWGRGAKAFLWLLAVVAVTDYAVWKVYPLGAGLAAIFVCAGLGTLWLRRARLSNRSVLVTSGVFLVTVLTLVEAPSLLGLFVALTGLTLLALAASQKLPRQYEAAGATLVRFAVLSPFRLLGDALTFVTGDAWKGMHGRLLRTVVIWIVPAVFAVAFLLLFSAANPVIEDVLAFLSPDLGLEVLEPWRAIVWLVVAGVFWPVLRPRLLSWAKTREMHGPIQPRAESLLFGRAAILRSLIVFNLLFAVQTVMDVLYLWGGVRLPDGLSYADYAHRGAYPLIATALLAAGFVLVAMRPRGPAQESALIRRLVYVWIAQNVLLVISSILRLDLYVKVYSLTEMRIAAGIWMGLVAVGLVLILLRIFWRRSNAWLVTSNLVSLGLTLMMCAFVDFSALIAQFNVENSRELGGDGQSLDLYYFNDLGPTALPAIVHFLDHAKDLDPGKAKEFEIMAGNIAAEVLATPADWRSWSFRQQRLSDWIRDNPRFADFRVEPGSLTAAPAPREDAQLSAD